MVVLRRLLVGLALLIAGVFAAAPQYSVGPISAVDAVVDSIAPQAQALTPSQRIILKRGISPVASWSAATDPFPSAILSHSRTSLATMFDSTGKLTYAPNNLLTYSNTFSNAAWVKSNVSVSGGVSDPFGGTSASTLTATAAGGLLFQNVSLASSQLINAINSIWIRRRTGTGTVYLYKPDGSNSTVAAVSDSWQQFYAAGPGSGTVVALDVQLASNGDAIDIYAGTTSVTTYETTPRIADQVITTSAAYYGPRIDYDPSTLAVKGLLIEEARTNYCPYSSALNNWTIANGSVTNNSGATLDPSGLNTATLITPTGGSNTNLTAPALAATGSTQYVASYFVKSAGAGYAQIAFYDGTNATLSTGTFNLTTGASTGTTGGASALTSENIGNGWWRLAITWTSAVSTASIIPVVYPKADGGGANPSASDKIYVWGPQYEKGAATSSYVANSSTGTTARAADVVQFTGAALAALQGASASGVVETGAINVGASNKVLVGYSGAFKSFAYATVPFPGVVGAYNGTTGFTAANSVDWTSTKRAAFGFGPGGRSVVADNGAVASDSNTVGSVTSVYIGYDQSSGYLNGYIRSLAIYNQRLPDATLKAKTVVGAPYAANDNGVRFAFANDNVPTFWRLAL